MSAAADAAMRLMGHLAVISFENAYKHVNKIVIVFGVWTVHMIACAAPLDSAQMG
jgi:hypothetical protein